LSISNMVGAPFGDRVGDRSGAGIGSQVTGCDAVDGAGFVVVGQVTADPDRTDDGVVVGADQHPAGDGHQVAAGRRHQRVDERGIRYRPCGQAWAAHPHGQRTVGFSAGDAFAQQARAVFAREGHQPSGAVQHRNRHRGKVAAAGGRKGAHHNGAGGGEADRGAPRVRHRTSKREKPFLLVSESTPHCPIAQPIVFV
jgi:hypothetical protein